MNLYKYGLSFLAFLLVACSASDNIDLSTPDSTIVTTETTVIQENVVEDDFDYDTALRNFENYWATLMKEDNPLTAAEVTITNNLRELMDEDFNWDEGTGGYFYLGEYTCYEKVRGTVPMGYLDERHPLALSDSDVYFPGAFWGYCSNSNSEELLAAFGIPFFQNGEWWTFVNTDLYANTLNDCKEIYGTCIYAMIAYLATKVKIEIPDEYSVTIDRAFNEYWINNKLKNYKPLTDEEIELSKEINEDKISNFFLADGTQCIKNTGGTRTLARIDEFDPLHPRELDDPGFIVWQDYYCSDENRPGRLYGDFFYQDGTWWIFVEQSSEEIDIDEPWDRKKLFVWKFATRTAVAPDTFNGNYSCRADADFIERAYERKELDEYYLYKDREKDYSKPITLDELEESIELLEKAQSYYTTALSVRLGYNFGKPEHLDYENSYIDAVLYGMIVYTEDNLESKYAMRDYLIENGPFETNADVTSWWNANARYSVVEWRTTDEYVAFYQGKMEPFEGIGNHIVDEADLPNPDWIISEEYPRKTLRKYCSTYITDLDPYHIGRQDFTEFLENNQYSLNQNDEDLFEFASNQNGPDSGSYLYKDWDDGINMMTCEGDGFTKEECESTASFEWENKNLYKTVNFKQITCADEMNEVVQAYVDKYLLRNADYSKPSPGIFGTAFESITFYVPKLNEEYPESIFSFGVWGYYASGGTLRYPYWDSFTFDLRTCKQVTYNQLVDVDFDLLAEKILQYVFIPNKENDDFIGSYRFDKEFFVREIFVSDSTLYVPFINCGVYCWDHLFINDPTEVESSKEAYTDRCAEPGYFNVPCNTWLTNKFSGFVAIPLKELVNNG